MSNEGIAPTGLQPVEENTNDRREAMRAAFDQIEQAEPAPQTPQAAQAPGPVVTEDESKDRFSPHYGKPAGRPRDETGRFVPKPADAPVDAAAQAQPEAWQQPPKSWKKELGADWAKLDPRYQQYVHEREQQMHAGIEPLLPKAQLADQIMQVAQPYMGTIQGLGLDLPRAVAGLMEVDHGLRTLPFEQKLRLLQETALSYGIDLSGQMPQVQPAYDPYVQQQQNELLQLKGQFNAYLQQQEQVLQREALDQIQKFSQTAEHFEEVKPTMAKLLQSGFAVGIEDAYEQAIRLTPEIFDAVQAARQAGQEAEKKKAAQAAVTRARAAAVSVKSATPGHQTPATAQDRRSVIREQLEALSERL